MRSTDICASSTWMLFILISFSHLDNSLTIPDLNLINIESSESNQDDHNDNNHSNESSIVHSGCTNCLRGSTDKKLAELIKLDAIKSQILSKLNLPSKPNITSSIPRELIQEALRKAHLKENSNSNNNKNGFSLFSKFHSSSRSKDYQSDEPTDHNNYVSNSQDDYYGKTSEIIAFAEPGKFDFAFYVHSIKFDFAFNFIKFH